MSVASAATVASSGCDSDSRPSSAVRTRDMPSTSGASGVHFTWFPGTGKSVPPALAMASAWLASWSDRKEHTSELQSLMRISYADFCLKQTKHELLNIHK